MRVKIAFVLLIIAQLACGGGGGAQRAKVINKFTTQKIKTFYYLTIEENDNQREVNVSERVWVNIPMNKACTITFDDFNCD